MLDRFYLEKIPLKGKDILIKDKNVIHQIANVLRLKINNVFVIFSNQIEYQVIIKNIEKDTITTTIIDKTTNHREPNKTIHLFPALLKKDNFEFILQKCTELGVTSFTPIVTNNTIVRDISKNKIIRYQNILKESTEQCGGLNVPILNPAISFADAIKNIEKLPGEKIIAWEGQQKNNISQTINPKINTYYLFIGPEGGFTSEEIKLTKKNNFTNVNLGNRILRAETAAITASALLLLNP
ncbi:MAG: RsmE family RNA methyltransferase [Candidatus Kerfeldbacteria bacterium]